MRRDGSLRTLRDVMAVCGMDTEGVEVDAGGGSSGEEHQPAVDMEVDEAVVEDTWMTCIEECPQFSPTVEQFLNPMKYIEEVVMQECAALHAGTVQSRFESSTVHTLLFSSCTILWQDSFCAIFLYPILE